MRIFLFLIAASAPAMASAQQAPPTQQPSAAAAAEPVISDEPDIIVEGQRNLPGAVIGDIPPEQQLGPSDIRSYGVSSVADLLTELAPQTQSGVGGPPVVLLNGKRIAGFREIRDIPTEAIARVDILAEEVALKYGFRADQKVVNIVLRRRFGAVTGELTDRIATEGGRNAPQAELDLLKIRNSGRFQLHSEYKSSSALTESERAIAAPVAGGTASAFDQRPFRTLLPFSRELQTNAVYARNFGNVSATFNGAIESSESKGLNGLPGATFLVPATSPFATGGAATSVSGVFDGSSFVPLAQNSRSITGHLGTTLNGAIDGWQWSLTGAYDHVDTRNFSDTGFDATAYQARVAAGDPIANPAGPFARSDLAARFYNSGSSVSNAGKVDALINGSPFSLPAGAVSTSLRLTGETTDLSSRSYRSGLIQSGDISRQRGNAQINIDLPITSRSKGVLAAIGDLSLNGNAAIEQVSDFGTLTTYGYGANWSPVKGVRLIGSVSDQDEAPSAQQLGNPVITTPNVRVFDYVAGTTATATTISGGNPFLTADNRHVDKIGLTLKPFDQTDLTLTANYTRQHTDNPIAGFPTPTAAIEAAFPTRFTRDEAGNLLRIDTRSINYARTESSNLRWGINFSKRLTSKIQKEIEAYRAGTGPNPFAGMSFPGQRRRRDGADDQTPPGGTTPSGARSANAGQAGAPTQAGQGASATPQAGEGPPSEEARGGGRGGLRGFGGRGGGGRGGGGGRLQFAVYHTLHLTDTVLVAAGGPRLDLLHGDAIGQNGGQARNEVEVQAGYTNNGLGARLSGNYMQGTRVNGGTPANPTALDFGSLTTFNLRLFGDLGGRLEWVKAHPFLRGTRVTLSFDNLLNSRQRVTDAMGATPVSFQPDYLDPLGRSIRLSIRKLFF
ncbi:TonB-dependent receptor [Sphingomonas oligophenolica]|uniref:TonB-dependent receptor n=1 Tax=Sphingomonas oligophenolica TaxID=301154 RepID=A0A502CCW6_9SPHN|nr:TonB-dependent receptor [Sphingomonas oligophenolica]TPG10818.1 TonB-dependent receptor [Sphingomonas oligophenolica]